ncbi:hypothetical protein ACLOJK_000966, partial [Asimina triloba]
MYRNSKSQSANSPANNVTNGKGGRAPYFKTSSDINPNELALGLGIRGYTST